MPSVALTNVRGENVTATRLEELAYLLRRGYRPVSGTVADAQTAFTGSLVEPAPLESGGGNTGIRPNTYASIGDSISAQGAPTSNSFSGLDSSRRSWQAWANVALAQRLEPVTSYAVSGKRIDQMLTEQLPQVLASSPRPGYCTVLGGTNDLTAGRTTEQIVTDLQVILTGLIGVGIRPIVGTILPRTGLTSAQTGVQMQVNRWIKQVAPRLGAVVVDWSTSLANADGTPKTNVLADGLHPTVYGASLMGQAFADAMRGLAPAVDRLPASNAESPLPNFLTNPLMLGTTGLVSTGGTGSVADGWRVTGAAGAAYTATLSKVARTDGIPGEWQQAVIASGSVQIHQRVPASPTRWAIGDVLEAFVEFEADANLSGATRFEATLEGQGANRSQALVAVANDTYTGVVGAVPSRGVIRIPPVTVGASTTEVWLVIRVVGGTGTVRFGRCFLGKTTT